MSRTITFTDEQSGNLLSLIRREYFAPSALERERAAAEELYQVVTLAPHVPDGEPQPEPRETDEFRHYQLASARNLRMRAGKPRGVAGESAVASRERGITRRAPGERPDPTQAEG
jgi:hypothetical protein